MKKLLSATAAAFFIAANVQAAPVHLNFHNSDLRSTIMMIARAGDINISVDDSVDGKISINLNGVEPEKALEIIAKTKNLRIYNESGIFIMTALPSTNFMKTYILPMKYGKAEDFRELIVMSLSGEIKYSAKDKDREKRAASSNITRITENADGSTTISTRKSDGETSGYANNDTSLITETILDAEKRVSVNPDVNALILFGTESEYERAKNLLQELDVELKQVSVEARILAIDKSASKNLGVEWFWSTLPQYPERKIEVTETNSGRVIETEKYTRNANDNTGYGVIQFGKSPSGYPFEMYYGAKINALVTNGKAKILSRPNVTTIQGHEAIINIGSSVPVPKVSTNNTSTTTEIEYKDAGIILRYTPRVNADGTITATIHTEVSTPQYVEDLKAYQFNTRSADTIVTVRDGEPMVIGGLIGAEDAKSVRKIPFLGDLPILGALFRSHKKDKSESELLIFLTAHVINGAGVGVPKNVKYSVPAGVTPHEMLNDNQN